VADPDGEMQAAMDKEQEQGFRGTKVDPTPNSAYTIAGVTGTPDPTPETDAALREEARKRSHGELTGGQSEITAEREPGEGN
jgi:hypothetical protein